MPWFLNTLPVFHDIEMNWGGGGRGGYFIPEQRFRSEVAEDLIAENRKCTGPCEKSCRLMRPRELPPSSMPLIRERSYTTRFLDHLPLEVWVPGQNRVVLTLLSNHGGQMLRKSTSLPFCACSNVDGMNLNSCLLARLSAL